MTHLKVDVAEQAYLKSLLSSARVTLVNQRVPSGSTVMRVELMLRSEPWSCCRRSNKCERHNGMRIMLIQITCAHLLIDKAVTPN